VAIVTDYMSGIDPVKRDTPLIEVARQMRHGGVGALPVLDDEGQCIGIVTERDIVIRVLAEECDARATIARDVATPNPITCNFDEQVPALMALMRENEIQHLPVLADGRVVGMISLADIVFSRPDERRGVGVPPPP
jgi:CBS domain-containing protein